MNRFRVCICANRHYRIIPNPEHEEPECYHCNEPMTPVTNPAILLEMAQAEVDTENQHILADEALYQRMLQLDREFAQSYDTLNLERQWYYS